MFPNVRLMIVAMLASIVAIGCGMGLFAAFRINHEPLTRLQSGNPPLQLVFGNGAPAPVTDAATAPFGVRFQLNAPAAVPVTMLAPSEQALSTAPVAVATSSSDAPATAPASAPTAAGADAGQEASPQASQQANPASEQDMKKDTAVDVALQSPVDQSPPAGPAAHDVDPAPDSATSTDTGATAQTIAKTTPQMATPTERKPARRRVAKLRRLRQPQPATGAPPALNFAFPPNFQSVPQAAAQTSPAPQAIKRRVAVKRHRPTKQTAAKETADPPTVMGGTISP